MADTSAFYSSNFVYRPPVRPFVRTTPVALLYPPSPPLGDVKVENVSAALSTAAGGTTDFVKAGFGSAKACRITVSFDASDDTNATAENKLSIGFSDFTNNFCISHQDEDASAKVDSDAIKSNTKSYIILDTAGAVLFSGTASLITDGVRLTHTAGEAPASAFFASVEMYGGTDLVEDIRRTAINSTLDGTATITHAGLTDGNEKLIFFIGTDIAAEDNVSTGINNSFGVCHISGNDAGGYTFTQRCLGWCSDHNNNVGSPSAIISTDRVLDIITEAGGQDWGLEVTAFSSSGGTITVTTRDVAAGAGMEVYSLIVDLDNIKAKVFSVDSPTSGATWAVTGLGFIPQYVGLGLTNLTSEDSIDSGANSGALGISSNAGSGGETCHSWYNEDAAATINTNNLFRSRVIDFRNDDVTTVIQDHSHLSFDSDGFTTTINTENETTAKKLFGWSIEEGAAVAEVLIAALGSYVYTGFASDLLWDHRVDAALGSYVYTGFDATLTRAISILAELGSYVYTGFASDLLWDHRVDAALGSYVYTGFAAGTLWDHSLTAALGSYVYTGFDAGFVRGFAMTAELGSYVYTGFVANLLWNHLLIAALGSYIYTGFDATLTEGAADTLLAELGSYIYTGFAANLIDSGSTVVGSYKPVLRPRRR